MAFGFFSPILPGRAVSRCAVIERVGVILNPLGDVAGEIVQPERAVSVGMGTHGVGAGRDDAQTLSRALRGIVLLTSLAVAALMSAAPAVGA